MVKLADTYDNLLDSMPPEGDPELHAKTRRRARVLLGELRPRRGEHPALVRAFDAIDRLLAETSQH